MGKYANDDALDALLAAIATGDEITVCSAEPTTYAEAHTTYKLAAGTLTPGDGNGDFTIGDGDASGRKLTVAEQAALTIDASDTATHIAITLTGSTKLLAVTTCTSQALTAGGTVTVPTFDLEVADPT